MLSKTERIFIGKNHQKLLSLYGSYIYTVAYVLSLY